MTLSKAALEVLAALVAPTSQFTLAIPVGSLPVIAAAYQELQAFAAEQAQTKALVDEVTAPLSPDELRAKLWPDFDALT